jgi:AcrR family transcriptional regulator
VPSNKLRSKSAKPYHHGNLRETLLDAAGALLAAHGAAQLTLRDIAKSARVSHAAPYHHFDSLDELISSLAERAFVSLGASMQRAAGVKDRREALVAICESYVAFARQQPQLFRLMFGPMLAQKQQHPVLKSAADKAFNILLKAAMDFDPADGGLLALTGWSLAHGLANLSIDGAFDSLPIAVADTSTLARHMAERMLSVR